MQNSKGQAAKHQSLLSQKALLINGADVAELVDARDLKSVDAIDIATFLFKTLGFNPIETNGTKRDLQNEYIPIHTKNNLK